MAMAYGMLLQLLSSLWVVVQAAPWTNENSAYNTNVNEAEDAKDFKGQWHSGKSEYHASPEDWRMLPIYQLITDRFADGDPLNNDGGDDYGGFDVRDVTWRHGGDFKGVTQHLDYIRGLGMRVIWISPVFQNGFNQYHQYAQRDFTLLDVRLGTLEELRQLTSLAHAKGMYVIVDVVVNHMDNCYDFEGGSKPWNFKKHDGEHTLKLKEHGSCHPKMPNGQAYRDYHHNNDYDPEGTYTPEPYFYYDWRGNAVKDNGAGTYTKSDFHHNGDLKDYQDPFQINTGKIYGIMDDLRTEGESVQQKHIAWAKALIASADIDGFRVDTPMQVDLGFFKAWVPAVKEYAKSLGKDNFGMWGEFFVESGRYATMMGRGKDKAMYGKADEFIPGPATLNGGIQYESWAFVKYKLFNTNADIAWPLTEYDRKLSDGLKKLDDQDNKGLDYFNPQTNRKENTMWHFCNNHDQWRMQALDIKDGEAKFKMCLVYITLWPGVPLHYAGDEQLFSTFGIALDGWSREELGVSHAWRAMSPGCRSTDEGCGLPQKDNFDMASPMYRFVAWINRIRQAFNTMTCDGELLDTIEGESLGEDTYSDLFMWTRTCAKEKTPPRTDPGYTIRVVINYGNKEIQASTGAFGSQAEVIDLLEYNAMLTTEERKAFAISGELVSFTMPAYGARVLISKKEGEDMMSSKAASAPMVVHSEPKHDEVVRLDTSSESPAVLVQIAFDRPVKAQEVSVTVDGQSLVMHSTQDSSSSHKLTYEYKLSMVHSKPGLRYMKVQLLGSATSSKAGACPDGYIQNAGMTGTAPFKDYESTEVKSPAECAAMCDKLVSSPSQCMSFEYSPTETFSPCCLLNTNRLPKDPEGTYKDFIFCSKADKDKEQTGDQTIYFSRFHVIDSTPNAYVPDVTIDPEKNHNPELVATDFKKLNHQAVGARYWRARNSNASINSAREGWSEWFEMPPWACRSSDRCGVDAKRDPSDWQSHPNVPVVVQYFSTGSSAYFAAGCLTAEGAPCKVSLYNSLHMRVGDWDAPDNPIPMVLSKDFTWTGTLKVGSKGANIWFVPTTDGGNGKIGSMMKSEIQLQMEKGARWRGRGEESMGSVAAWAQQVKVTPCCRLQTLDENQEDSGCCDPDPSGTRQCIITINDLTLKLEAVNPAPSTKCQLVVLGMSGLTVGIVVVFVLAAIIGGALFYMKRDVRAPRLSSSSGHDADSPAMEMGTGPGAAKPLTQH